MSPLTWKPDVSKLIIIIPWKFTQPLNPVHSSQLYTFKPFISQCRFCPRNNNNNSLVFPGTYTHTHNCPRDEQLLIPVVNNISQALLCNGVRPVLCDFPGNLCNLRVRWRCGQEPISYGWGTYTSLSAGTLGIKFPGSGGWWIWWPRVQPRIMHGDCPFHRRQHTRQGE